MIGVVLFINLQAGVSFFLHPLTFAPFYELSGGVGIATIQGFGVLFIMWNVPYVVAMIHPLKNRISLYEAVAMQMIGLVGESIILWKLPIEHAILRNSLVRFIFFDGAGLIALILVVWITYEFRGGGKKD